MCNGRVTRLAAHTCVQNIPSPPLADEMRKVKYGGREELRKMSSSPVSHGSKGSYEDESFETAEESLLGDGSPVVWGRQESVFLAESSSSSFAEDSGQKSQAFGGASMSESCETILSESKAGSESIKITEECGYSDQFESIASLTDEAEEELSTKVIFHSRKERTKILRIFLNIPKFGRGLVYSISN